MFKFFNFGRGKPVRPPAAGPVSVLPNTQSHTNVQRELIRVVLKDTLRLHGIPANWVGCEVIVKSRSSAQEEMYVHLIIMEWNESLLRFAPALQQQLIQGLNRFDPAVDHSRYVLSWRFACECPYISMPDPTFWSLNAGVPTAAPVLSPIARPVKPKFDLPESSRDYMPSDFAPTQQGPML
ncbi:MAG: hypothetical protein RIS34_785 [Pseudomonadota bacterium]|jgi:hypothetical protein